jgi:hypothetical protein
MKYANQFEQQLATLRSEVADAIKANLKRIGTTHTNEDAEPLRFFNVFICEDRQVDKISAEGKITFPFSTQADISQYIEDGLIEISDAIELLQELEEI